MKITVHLELDVNPDEWEGRRQGVAVKTAHNSDTYIRIANEVRSHVNNVISDLYADQGWLNT